MKVVIDIEANALHNPTKIWLIVCKDVDTGIYYKFRKVSDDARVQSDFREFWERCDLVIGHNWLGYDWSVLVSLLGPLTEKPCLDTLVISKLVDYSRQGHSVEDYGLEFGLEKGKFNDFSKYSEEMESYCIRDVDITHRIWLKYLKYINNPERTASITLEHRFQLVCNSLEKDGFAFNLSSARRLLDKVELELAQLDEAILLSFPPKLKLIREITPKETKHGTISLASIPITMRKDVADLTVGGSFSYCAWHEFNPSSHKQIIGILNDAGWSPVDRTQTHINTERELNKVKRDARRNSQLDTRVQELYTKLNNLKITGWKVSEQNLETLPDIEPLILWKDKCHIKIADEEKVILESIIKEILIKNEPKLSRTTIKIQELLKTSNSKEIMGLLLRILKGCLPNKTDVAKFVENGSSLWSIIVTPKDTFVDCSASFVTDTWVGMRDLESLQKDISKTQAVKTIAKRIILEARRRTLTEWLELVQEDGRIHGRFFGIGTWPHRMAHQNPNTANIPNELDTFGKKKLYGKELRSFWMAPKNRLLVGVDAEGIQLRIFAHYINDPEFTDALVKGKKEDKSDPHSLNQSILGAVCKSRQAAKRYIYALLLGAGMGKLQEILGCDQQAASEAYDRLLQRYTGFAALKETIIPADAKRGWFVGLDGRAVRIPGDTTGARRHLAMSGYLQNGEAVVMKMATLKWWPLLKNYDAKLVNFVHDEWQTEVPNNIEIALAVARMQADSLRLVGEELNLKCPLAGSYWNDDLNDYTIHTNWSKTH